MSNTQPPKLALARKPSEPIRLGQDEVVHVGVDAHKASYSVALVGVCYDKVPCDGSPGACLSIGEVDSASRQAVDAPCPADSSSLCPLSIVKSDGAGDLRG
jgi:hypothetical protein